MISPLAGSGCRICVEEERKRGSSYWPGFACAQNKNRAGRAVRYQSLYSHLWYVYPQMLKSLRSHSWLRGASSSFKTSQGYLNPEAYHKDYSLKKTKQKTNIKSPQKSLKCESKHSSFFFFHFSGILQQNNEVQFGDEALLRFSSWERETVTFRLNWGLERG